MTGQARLMEVAWTIRRPQKSEQETRGAWALALAGNWRIGEKASFDPPSTWLGTYILGCFCYRTIDIACSIAFWYSSLEKTSQSAHVVVLPSFLPVLVPVPKLMLEMKHGSWRISPSHDSNAQTSRDICAWLMWCGRQLGLILRTNISSLFFLERLYSHIYSKLCSFASLLPAANVILRAVTSFPQHIYKHHLIAYPGAIF
jgi:hypothetical protein